MRRFLFFSFTLKGLFGLITGDRIKIDIRSARHIAQIQYTEIPYIYLYDNITVKYTKMDRIKQLSDFSQWYPPAKLLSGIKTSININVSINLCSRAPNIKVASKFADISIIVPKQYMYIFLSSLLITLPSISVSVIKLLILSNKNATPEFFIIQG